MLPLWKLLTPCCFIIYRFNGNSYLFIIILMGISLKQSKKNYYAVNCIFLCCSLWITFPQNWIFWQPSWHSQSWYICTEASKSSITWAQFIVKTVSMKPYLVILKVLPFCTLASVVQTLLETFLPVLFWYDHEPCHCSMLNFFYESNVMTFEPSLEPWE
jgi:hypothetical protein